MSGNRKKAEALCLSLLKQLGPKGFTANRYKELFAEMSDKEFDQFINDLESGAKFLIMISPNWNDEGISVENNLALADSLGHKFFQKIWIEGTGENPTIQTPIEHMVLDLPVKRCSQTLEKKISVPPDNKVVDALTGQPTGDSKGARVSFPELQLCAAMNLDNAMIESMKYLGGDTRGLAAYNAMLSQTGRVNLKALEPYASGVESTHTLRTLLTCMHLANNL